MPPAEVLDQRDDADGHTHNHSDIQLGGSLDDGRSDSSDGTLALWGGSNLLCECVWWAYDANDAIIATIYFLRMHLSIYLLIHSVS